MYKTFTEWKNGNWLEDGEPRKEAYTKDELLLVEMGWKYGFDAGKALQAEQIAELEFENKAFRKELFNIGSMRSCSYAAQHHGFVSPRQAGDDAREYIAEILEKAKREIK